MSKQFVFTIGFPFSGKSELAKQYAEQGFTVIERDVLLQEVVNSTAFLETVDNVCEVEQPASPAAEFAIKNRIAIEMLNKRLQKAVAESKSDRIFYDGTNLQKKVRAGLKMFEQEGFDVHGLFLAIPVDEILRRAKEAYQTDARAGEFNEGAIANLVRIFDMLELPEASEGLHIDVLTSVTEVTEPGQEYKLGIYKK